jgi:hypothetical protein
MYANLSFIYSNGIYHNDEDVQKSLHAYKISNQYFWVYFKLRKQNKKEKKKKDGKMNN